MHYFTAKKKTQEEDIGCILKRKFLSYKPDLYTKLEELKKFQNVLLFQNVFQQYFY